MRQKTPKALPKTAHARVSRFARVSLSFPLLKPYLKGAEISHVGFPTGLHPAHSGGSWPNLNVVEQALQCKPLSFRHHLHGLFIAQVPNVALQAQDRGALEDEVPKTYSLDPAQHLGDKSGLLSH